jgi:NADPH-dependent 2,4-dienoyl-CoA reductase/sulfur reductase-like enzyme
MTAHVAIVGAGLGGLRAAEQLRAAGHEGPVTVIGAEAHLPYNRPPLSKELLRHDLAAGIGTADAGAGRDELAALHEKVVFRRRASVTDVTFLLGAAVTAADLDARRLLLEDGAAISFDGLVIATGIRPRRLSVPGPTAGRHVIRNLGDVLALRAELRAALTGGAASANAFSPGEDPCATPADDAVRATEAGATGGTGLPQVVVVGGGFIGCEAACTALALGCAVTVVEPAGEPMERVLGAELGATIRRSHEKSGIRFIIGQGVIGYLGDGRVAGVVLGDGTRLPAAIVIEAVGSVPNTEWLAGAGLDITDGVLCDNSLAAVAPAGSPAGSSAGATTGAFPGVPVVAVGDVARFPNPLFDDVPRRVEHWSMPTDTARRAAATLHAKLAGGTEQQPSFWPIPSFWSDQGELRLQSFGLPGLADRVLIAEGDPDQPGSGLLAHYHRGGQYVGSVAVNLPPARLRELRAALATAERDR